MSVSDSHVKHKQTRVYSSFGGDLASLTFRCFLSCRSASNAASLFRMYAFLRECKKKKKRKHITASLLCPIASFSDDPRSPFFPLFPVFAFVFSIAPPLLFGGHFPSWVWQRPLGRSPHPDSRPNLNPTLPYPDGQNKKEKDPRRDDEGVQRTKRQSNERKRLET